jgi:S1-C subfamily serine protease
MSKVTNILDQLSGALETQVARAGELAVAVRNAAHQHVSGMLWQPDIVVTSEQAVGGRDEYEIVTARGEATKARIVGRDPGTNLLVLKPDTAVPVQPPMQPGVAGSARTGALVLALGTDVNGSSTVRLGIVHSVGPQWVSRAGGRLEQRIGLDIRLARTEEGGPVVDTGGALLGMSTLGVRGEVLVIPRATIERVVPQLVQHGCVPRGWLGLALQPVAVPDALRDAAGQRAGMMVMSIAAGSPGAEADIHAGDILLTIDGASVRQGRQLAAMLDADSIGKRRELRLIRGGEVLQVEVLIAARPREGSQPPRS